jgi:hypothetical protein
MRREASDTTAPKLKVTFDKKKAKNGSLAYTIATERGATVKVISKTRKLRNKSTAGSKPIRKNIDVDEGTYRLAIRASDDTGNKTERSYKVTVA